MQRNWLCRCRLDVGPHGAISRIDRIRLRSQRQIDHGLRQRQTTLRLPEKVHRILRGEAEIQRLRSRQSDVFHRHAHDPARAVHRVFASLEHPAQPIERRIGVGVPHTLVQRRDDVVVLLALLVVEQYPPLQRLRRQRLGDGVVTALLRQLRRHLQRIQSVASVAAGVRGERGQCLIVGLNSRRAQATLGIAKRSPQQRNYLLLCQADQRIHPASRQQRGIDLERRVLRRRSDQPDRPALDIRQKRILLGLVEAVNLVDEQDGARPEPSRLLCLHHHLLDLFDPGEHSRKLDEARLSLLRNDLRERRLPGPRRTPEDHRDRVIALNGQPQRLARRQQMLLPDVLLQRARSHPLRQRSLSAMRSRSRQRTGIEQAHRASPEAAAALCREASYSSSDPATAAFKLSTGPGQGIVTLASAISSHSAARPAPSLPIISAQAPARFASCAAITPTSSVPTAASSRTPRCFNAAISSTVTPTTGTRNTLPTLARRAFWFQALTVPGVVSTPAAPNASAERTSVPRLPGSCKPAAIRINGAACSITSSSVRTGGMISAATPCGDCVSTTLAKTSSVSRSSSTLRGTIPGTVRRSLTKTVFSTMPLRSASSSRWSPSIATSPPLSRA